MSLSQIALSSAASEIRVAERILSSAVAELQAAQIWSGDDANRFQAEWHDLVSARLHSAANLVDACSLIPYLI